VTKHLFFNLLQDTWLTLFRSSLIFIDPQPQAQECLFECFVEIPIVGKKKFLLVFALPEKLSYEVASDFFQLKQEELTKEDASDAINELVNMLAGQVQQELSEDTILDLPLALSRDQAQRLIMDIQPDWEIYARHHEHVLYAGVFIAYHSQDDSNKLTDNKLTDNNLTDSNT
jgi:tRNA A58 N-methylase Trm61